MNLAQIAALRWIREASRTDLLAFLQFFYSPAAEPVVFRKGQAMATLRDSAFFAVSAQGENKERMHIILRNTYCDATQGREILGAYLTSAK